MGYEYTDFNMLYDTDMEIRKFCLTVQIYRCHFCFVVYSARPEAENVTITVSKQIVFASLVNGCQGESATKICSSKQLTQTISSAVVGV